MTKRTAGIHHITAFAHHTQDNVDFYAGVLGLRLVKKTVNFDAPDVYHFYFGNEVGSPGTVMTFFPFEQGRQGRAGGGQVGWTTFAVPPESLAFWRERLEMFAIPYEQHNRFGDTYLRFRDHDGLQLELVERKEGPDSRWSFGGVPQDRAIKGFDGAVLFSTAPDQTMQTLEQVFGLTKVGEDEGLVRYTSHGNLGSHIDVSRQAVPRGHGGYGTIHHIAWRADDVQDQEEWRKRVAGAGFDPTPIVDRQYFTSVYFREHGEILFEIATDGPGFERDESFDKLGEELKLPEWYEQHREHLLRHLPPVKVRVLERDQVQEQD